MNQQINAGDIISYFRNKLNFLNSIKEPHNEDIFITHSVSYEYLINSDGSMFLLLVSDLDDINSIRLTKYPSVSSNKSQKVIATGIDVLNFSNC